MSRPASHEAIYSGFDAFVAKHRINLERGHFLDSGGMLAAHRSGAFAVKLLKHPSNIPRTEQIIDHYVTSLARGLHAPNLEQIRVARSVRGRGCIISDFIPGTEGRYIRPADLAKITRKGIDRLVPTLETAQAKGIQFDGNEAEPSPNIIISDGFHFIDYTYPVSPEQELAFKWGIVLTTILKPGIKGEKPNTVRTGLAAAVQQKCLARYGTRHDVTQRVQGIIDYHAKSQ